MATPDQSAIAAVPSDAETTAPPNVTVVVVAEPSLVDPELQRKGHLVWAAATSALLFSSLLLLRLLPTVAWPLILAAIGAYLLDPVVTWCARRGVSRPLSSAILVGAGALFVIGFVISLLPKVLEQMARIPMHFRFAIDIVLAKLSLLGNKAIPEDFEHLLVFAREHVPDILTKVLPGASSVVTTVVGGSLSVLSSILGALIVPVVGYYLLKDWPNLVKNTEALIPSKQRPYFHARMKEIDRVLNGFIRGQLTMAAVLSALYATGLSAVGLKMAVIVGLVTGFGNLVPYVGTATGLTLTAASCLVDFGVDYHLALALIVFFSIMITDSIFITPRIVGNRVGLSPAAVIVSVLTCGSLFGFGGVLLAVPSVAILKVVTRVLLDAYRESKLYREG